MPQRRKSRKTSSKSTSESVSSGRPQAQETSISMRESGPSGQFSQTGSSSAGQSRKKKRNNKSSRG